MHIRISLSIIFHSEQIVLNFWTKFAQKRYLLSKAEKVNAIIEFWLFTLVLVPNFSLNWQFWFFWPDLPKKSFSGLQQKKWTPHIFYIILHIQISLVQNFRSNWQFQFYIFELVLSTKFKFKLIILSSWTKFTPKRYFQLRTEQAIQGLQAFAFCVVNVNGTVVFKHVKDFKDLIILNILKDKLFMLCLLGSFYLKIV